jgi:hypothetical protein
VRVSLELPEAGTCVGMVTGTQHNMISLELLDEVPDGELEGGLTLDMFMPRPQGIYHWMCTLSAAPEGRRALVELLGEPTFVQRRVGQRVESSAQAQVRRLRSGRRGPAHPAMVVNLSRGGMKLQGPFQASTGDTVEVSVELDQRVALLGRAVMTYPLAEGTWATHVSFLPGQRAALDALDEYIASRLREGRRPV